MSVFTEPCDAVEAEPVGAEPVGADVAGDAVVGADVAADVGVDAVEAPGPGAPVLAADESQALTAPHDATRMAAATDVLMFMVPLPDGHAFDHKDVHSG